MDRNSCDAPSLRESPVTAPDAASVVVAPAACYTVRNGWAWAHIFVRHGMGTNLDGSPRGWVHLSVISDYGSFGYCWTHIGACPWREFLTGLDLHYAMNKMLGPRFKVPLSGIEAEEKARSLVIDGRRNGISKSDARELWDGIPAGDDFPEAGEFCRAWDSQSSGAFYRHELWDCEWQKVNPQATGFWSDVWPVFRSQLEAETASDSRKDGASPPPSTRGKP